MCCRWSRFTVRCGMRLPSKSLWLRLQSFVCSFETGSGGGGGTGFSSSVATARPTAEMNNFEPLINRQNFHHSRYSSESDIFRTALLSWLRNWFAVYRYKTDKWSPSVLGSIYCNTNCGPGIPYLFQFWARLLRRGNIAVAWREQNAIPHCLQSWNRRFISTH
jgi:hypothetical protein